MRTKLIAAWDTPGSWLPGPTPFKTVFTRPRPKADQCRARGDEGHQTWAELGQLSFYPALPLPTVRNLSLSILLRFRLLAVLPRAEIRPSYLRGFALQRDHK